MFSLKTGFSCLHFIIISLHGQCAAPSQVQGVAGVGAVEIASANNCNAGILLASTYIEARSEYYSNSCNGTACHDLFARQKEYKQGYLFISGHTYQPPYLHADLSVSSVQYPRRYRSRKLNRYGSTLSTACLLMMDDAAVKFNTIHIRPGVVIYRLYCFR